MFAAWLFAVPLILSFGRDWLVVSATIDADSAGYQRVRRRAKILCEQWLPPVVRLAGAALTAWLIAQGDISGAVLWLAAPAAILLLLGVVGRAAALVLAFVAAFVASSSGLALDNGLLLLCGVLTLHLGSGRFALWTPEEYYLHAKLGARDEATT